VLRRLVATSAAFLDALEKRGLDNKNDWLAKPPKAGTETMMKRCLAKSSHEISETFSMLEEAPPSLTCTNCRQSVAKGGLTAFLATACTKPVAQQHVPDIAVPSVAVTVGNTVLDGSHTLLYTGGVWMCSVCAIHATSTTGRKAAPRKLAKPCKGRSAAGKAKLRRVEKGLSKAGTPNPRNRA
jgi:hypothetical protein